MMACQLNRSRFLSTIRTRPVIIKGKEMYEVLQTIKAEMVMDEGVRCMERGEEMDCVTPHGKTSNRVVPE